jgi:HK97 family phage major capsid protein
VDHPLAHLIVGTEARRLSGPTAGAIDPTQGVKPTLWGHPVFIRNLTPIAQTVGTSTDRSTVFLADMSQVVVARSREVELVISDQVYFENDPVGLRVAGRFALGLPQPTAVVKTVGVPP